MHYETLISALIVLVGIILAARGLRREWQGIMLPTRDPRKVETFFRGFRMSIIGLALIGIATAWATDQLWLLMLSLAIGIEETIESTIDIWGLNSGRTIRLGPQARVQPKPSTFTADTDRLIAAMNGCAALSVRSDQQIEKLNPRNPRRKTFTDPNYW